MRIANRLHLGACAAALLVAASGALVSAPGAGAAPARAVATTPSLAFALDADGRLSLTSGPTSFGAGYVDYTLTTADTPAGSVGFIRLEKGYSYADFKADAGKESVKAIKRAIAHTTFYGGSSALAPSTTYTGSTKLPKAGTYYAYSFGENGPLNKIKLTVGDPVARTAPTVGGTVEAVAGNQFSVSGDLPSGEGTLRFKNDSDSGSPHFMSVVQVTDGTTAADIVDWFNEQTGPPSGPPEWWVADAFDTEVLSPGRSMTVDYNLPAGHYAVMCFFPDVNMGGMPHAFGGMVQTFDVVDPATS